MVIRAFKLPVYLLKLLCWLILYFLKVFYCIFSCSLGTFCNITSKMPDLCCIYSSIKYMYRASKFFGIFPYKIDTLNGKTKATPSHCSFLVSVLTSLVVIAHGLTFPFYVFGSEVPCFFCITNPNIASNSTPHEHFITPILFQRIALQIINRLPVSIMSYCTLLFALFFSSRVPAFIEKLDDTDYFFSTLLKHSKKSMRCCISKWIVFSLLIGSFPTVSYYMYTDISGPDTTITSIVWLVLLMWDNMNSATCDCLFMNFVYLLKVRFEIINNYLIDIHPLDLELKVVR